MIPLVYKGILLKNAMGFNRTFMELKLPSACNCKICVLRFNRTFMELKHYQTMLATLKIKCFNRTFMELKLASVRRTCNVHQF